MCLVTLGVTQKLKCQEMVKKQSGDNKKKY